MQTRHFETETVTSHESLTRSIGDLQSPSPSETPTDPLSSTTIIHLLIQFIIHRRCYAPHSHSSSFIVFMSSCVSSMESPGVVSGDGWRPPILPQYVLEDIFRRLSTVEDDRKSLLELGRSLWSEWSLTVREHTEIEKQIEEEELTRREKHIEKLWWGLSNLTSTKPSKGRLTDTDAADLIVNSEVKCQENGDGLEVELDQRFYAFVSAKLDKINFESCLLDVLCGELVEKVRYAVVVSTVALLSIVYNYLLGYVLKGGTKAYSGSLDFRDTFVSVLLFRGSYVWIFFRDVAPRKVYRRSKKDEAGRILCYHGKFEPRIKPRRMKLPGGATIKYDHLPLGGYDSHRDAEIMCQIAGYLCESDEADIKLRDGSIFTIPPMPVQEQSLFGRDKVRCVVARAREVFEKFQAKNNAIILPSESNTAGVLDNVHDVTVTEKFSVDVLSDAADVYLVDWGFADSFRADTVDSEFVDDLCADGEGLEGTVTPPSSADLNFADSLIAVEEGSEGLLPSPAMAEQVVLSMERPQSLHFETSDAGSITKLKTLTQQLKEQLEAEISRRIAEQHEQHERHLRREKQLEERILQLERNAMLRLDFR